MSPDEVHGRAVDRANHLTGVVDVGEPGAFGVDRVDQLVTPRAGSQVHQRGGTRTRPLGQHDTAQLVQQQFGEHQHARGPIQFPTVVHGELEDRVPGHQLDAGAVVDLPSPDAVGDGVPSGESVVAIGVRGSDETSVGIEQAVVEPPGVDPDGCQRTVLAGECQTTTGLGDERVPVPPQRAVGVADRSVMVAVDDDRLERPSFEIDDGDADGRGTEVDGGDERSVPRWARIAHSPAAACPEPRSRATWSR